MDYDFCVIGGGIVGLASAMAIQKRWPGSSIAIVEKEPAVSVHQTGHNSGVIHSGIYYQPGSLKAKLCREGEIATKAFCQKHSIPFETCGKLIVATNDLEVHRLKVLDQRAKENDVDAVWLDKAALAEKEPNITGESALLIKSTGIVDYRQVCEKLSCEVIDKGGELFLGNAVTLINAVQDGVSIGFGGKKITARYLVACAGLQSDRIARLAGLPVAHKIVPFRGEYYQLPAERNNIVNHLIYPVPDPELPFLGIHLTKMIDGSVTVGPNAVLGFSREGYSKFSFNFQDIWDYVSFTGFWKGIAKYLKSGIEEFKNSLFVRGYLSECQKYCPSLRLEDLRPYEAGIRAQAVMKNGEMIHDFLFLENDRMLHVCNAPSPAATSALPIGEMITEKLAGKVVESQLSNYPQKNGVSDAA